MSLLSLYLPLASVTVLSLLLLILLQLVFNFFDLTVPTGLIDLSLLSLSKLYPFVVQTLRKVRKSIIGNMLVVSSISDHDFDRVALKFGFVLCL